MADSFSGGKDGENAKAVPSCERSQEEGEEAKERRAEWTKIFEQADKAEGTDRGPFDGKVENPLNSQQMKA